MPFSRSFVFSSAIGVAAAALAGCSGSSGTAVAPIVGNASASPVPSATPSLTPSAAPSPTITPTPTPAPTATPTPTPTPTPMPTATPTASPTASPTPSPSPVATTTTAADGCPEYASGNIVVDPGAEGATTADMAGDMVPVPAWTPSGTFTAVQYNSTEGTFPTLADPGAPNPGANLFSGGPSAALSTGRQIYALTGTQLGTTPFVMCGWFGGYLSQGDNATLDAEFVSSGGTDLADDVIGGVTAAQRNDATSLQRATFAGTIPAGATSLILTLTMTRTDGTYNDGYADNLDVSIGPLGLVPTTRKPARTTLRASTR